MPIGLPQQSTSVGSVSSRMIAWAWPRNLFLKFVVFSTVVYSRFIFPVQRLRVYLNAEHINKKKKPFDFTSWENWAPDVNFELFASSL